VGVNSAQILITNMMLNTADPITPLIPISSCKKEGKIRRTFYEFSESWWMRNVSNEG